MTDRVLKRRAPILDGRLSAAMEMAEDCRVFADIGADHGRLSTVLLLQDESRYALVADISHLALEKARTLIGKMDLNARAQFAVSDGLDALDSLEDKAIDTVFVLGMGGETLSGILMRGQTKLRGATLILGAQTDLPLVRRTLCSIGYRIRKEVIASEGKHHYVLLRATPAENGESGYTEEELLLGPCLLKTMPENWLPVLEGRKKLLTQGVNAMRAAQLAKDEERLSEFEYELRCTEAMLSKLRKEG